MLIHRLILEKIWSSTSERKLNTIPLIPAKKGVKKIATKTAIDGERSHPETRSSMAGLQFLVSCLHRFLREGRYGDRVGASASIFLAAVLKYPMRVILDLLGIQLASICSSTN
jgi:hypothetical protein